MVLRRCGAAIRLLGCTDVNACESMDFAREVSTAAEVDNADVGSGQ